MDLRIDNKPMTRGVTHLMYVGDDEAATDAIQACEQRRAKAFTPLIIAGAAYALLGKNTKYRKAAGIASLALFIAI